MFGDDWDFVGFLDLDSFVVVVLFLGKEEVILDRSEDLVEVELSFFNWDFSVSFSSGVSLVLFLVETETESDKESFVFSSLIEPKSEEEILVNLVWFLEEAVVDLMSLV